MYWSNESLNQRVYELTERAIHASSDEEVDRVIWEFEKIVQLDGYGLPIQKAFLLWESNKISPERLVLFFESCYKWANEFEGEKSWNLKDEVARWTFHFAWRLARSNRREIKKSLDDLSEFINLFYSFTYEGTEYVRAFEKARRALDCLYKIFSECDLVE